MMVTIGDNRVTDLNAIYALVIGLLSNNRYNDISLSRMSFHLCRTSMLTGEGMRIAKNKSQLKSLKAEVSS